jgi:hypothetical protein
MTTRDERRRLAILGYHHIGKPSRGQAGTRWYLSEKAFEEHLSYLRDAGWNVVGLDTFLQGLTQPEVFPANPVLITFDDCHRSLREVALRLLQRFGYPALAFAPTDFRAVPTDIILNFSARVVVTPTNAPHRPRGIERRERTADDHRHDDHAPSATTL